jgi:alpha-beta hydrolase superfamily lysophospholipase
VTTEVRRSAHLSALWLATLLVSACAPAVPAIDPRPAVPALAGDLGTYRFADGSCVTGGRFDESGGTRLLLTDVWRNSRGGIFGGDGSDGEAASFRSLIDPGNTLAFAEGRGTLRWKVDDGTDTATRIHAPRRIGARIDSAGTALAGSLYLPAATVPGRYPGIVLAHGSGPQNRHAGPWTTFFVDLGFAVLSYDKRGVGESGGDFKASDYTDLEADLESAVRWLAARPEVDDQRVGVHASSQSGWYAPSVAGDAPLAFLLVRAGPTLPTGPTTAHEQVQEWRADGLGEADIAQASAFWAALMALATGHGTREAAQQRLDAARGQPWFAPAFGDWNTIRPQWWRQQLANAGFRPAQDLARHPLPTLWFLAERDENVPHAASAAALRETDFPAGMVTMVTVEDAGHDFLIRGEDGSIRYTNAYWPRMAQWLRERGFAGTATPAAGCAGAMDR